MSRLILCYNSCLVSVPRNVVNNTDILSVGVHEQKLKLGRVQVHAQEVSPMIYNVIHILLCDPCEILSAVFLFQRFSINHSDVRMFADRVLELTNVLTNIVVIYIMCVYIGIVMFISFGRRMPESFMMLQD